MKKSIKSLTLVVFIFMFAAASAGYAADGKIPYPKSYDVISSGASSYLGSSNSTDSIYFAAPDWYEMKSSESRTVLTHYPTYQQTTEFTCGPACALTVLYYGGEKKHDELQISRAMGTLSEIDDNGEIGTSTEKMVNYFKSLGWETDSSMRTADISGTSFEEITAFKDFVLSCLKRNIPVMVENLYMGGHWRVIIGYDTMGTPRTQDDVLIFADTYDVNDHKQDGYMAEAAENFFYTWLDIGMLPAEHREQQWLIAYPKNALKEPLPKTGKQQ